jgi:uncharacterized protein involved in response to NO
MTDSSASDAALARVPLLGLGLRPFFLASALWAVVPMVIWLPYWMGVFDLPTAFDPLEWHIHEMLFGYAGAALAGFLLTAVPSWTGAVPVRGGQLAGLAALWLVGRLAVSTSEILSPLVAAVVDVAFPLLLALWVARACVVSGNRKNLVLTALVGLVAIASALHHAAPLGLGDLSEPARALALGAFALLIGLVGGRVTPNFTRNWLKSRNHAPLPPDFGVVDRGALLLLAATVLAWVILPPENAVTGVLALAAAALHLIRLARWRGLAVLSDPLLAVLHLGYLWLPIGLLLLGLGQLGAVPLAAAAHALGAGAFAIMILGVMSRATLGHTGRPLEVGLGTTVLYLIALASVVLRVLSALIPGLGIPGLHGAAGLWILAHLMFLAIYGPMLLKPRVDTP